MPITRQRSNDEQVHAATMQPASSPSLPPSTAALLDNLIFGALKTPTAQPSVHHYYLSSVPTPSRVRLENTAIGMPKLLYLTPEVIAVGRGRGQPPPRRPKLKFRPRHIGHFSPLYKNICRDV